MKILIVALNFKPNLGGVAEYTYQIAKHLYKAGHEVIVLSKCYKDDIDIDSRLPYRVIRYDYDALRYRKLKRLSSGFKEIYSIIKANSVEIIISNNLRSESHLCWIISRIMKIPFCIFTHGLDVRRKLKFSKRIQRYFFLKYADLVFCNSSYTERIVRAIGARKTAILNPGLDRGFKEQSSVSEPCFFRENEIADKRVLLTVCRIVERKGIDNVIRALSIVKKEIPDILYIVVGEGTYKKHLESMVYKMKLGDVVKFVGSIADDEKGWFYQRSEIFIMPNRMLQNGSVEGFGIVFLEANAFKLPVIGGNSGGVVDAIENNTNGLLVNPYSVEEISKSIIKLLKDREFAMMLGVQGEKRLERFYWDIIIKQMLVNLGGLLTRPKVLRKPLFSDQITL